MGTGIRHLGIRIEKPLHKQLRIQALEEERPMNDLVCEAIRDYLASQDGKSKRGPA